jgi:hypothetical protein
MGEVVILQLAADFSPGALGELLSARARPPRVVRLDAGEPVPSVEDLRALVVLGGAVPGKAERALAAACVEASVPVLATGEGACALLGGQPVVGEPELQPLRPVDAEDPVLGPVPEGQHVVVEARLPEPPADAHLLAEFSDGAAAVRLGESAYALGFHPEYDGAWLADNLDDAAAAAEARRHDRFVRAQGAALLGRWVDAVVGRTDEESPWGRRGPAAAPRAGAYLNPE